MAVTFISNGYDTTAANPYTESAWADAHPTIGLATYGVRSPLDWKVSAVAGADRTVSINAGRGFGHGVTDKTFENETIQLDPITSGSRWDLIACRRDWTPTSGQSKFVKVNGGATAVIPGGRLYGPGNIDDQPLALVQVTAGQTQPTGFIDLRTWAGDGGGLIGAHDLVRSFLNKTGTRIYIDGVDWVRRVGVNDTPVWVRTSSQVLTQRGFYATEWYGPEEATVGALTIPDPGVPYRIKTSGSLVVYSDAAAGLAARVRLTNAAGPQIGGDAVKPSGIGSYLAFSMTLGAGGVSEVITGASKIDATIKRIYGTGGWTITATGNVLTAEIIPA